VRATAVASAVLAASLLWLLAWTLDIDLKVDQHNGQPSMHIGLPMVAGFTLSVYLLGWGACCAGTFSAPAANYLDGARLRSPGAVLCPDPQCRRHAGTKIVLSLMYLAVAAVLVPMLRRTRPTLATATGAQGNPMTAAEAKPRSGLDRTWPTPQVKQRVADVLETARGWRSRWPVLKAGLHGTSWVLGPGDQVATLGGTAQELMLASWGRLPMP
jgi:hypothetical protein